jgi:hypothetical protein
VNLIHLTRQRKQLQPLWTGIINLQVQHNVENIPTTHRLSPTYVMVFILGDKYIPETHKAFLRGIFNKQIAKYLTVKVSINLCLTALP